MYIKDKISLLQLSLIEGAGPIVTRKLLEQVDDISQIYNFSLSDFLKLGFSHHKAELLFMGLRQDELLNRELKLIEQHDISWTTVLDDDYPELLKQIHNPPIVLYWRGDLQQSSQNGMAVIGSRRANYYGKAVINDLVPKLVQAGYSIISGGAIGADTMAHQAALAAGGRTVVVNGAGLLNPYPAPNRKLFEKIIYEGGALVSPFPLLMTSFPGNFPSRNRIVAGMSKGCLVVQAASKSGTKITAAHALEQGREVFAVPGQFGDSLSTGCHELIQQGAKLTHGINDILTELEGDLVGWQGSKSVVEGIKSSEDDPVLFLCRQPKSFDELVQSADLQPDKLQSKLFDLQIAGKVKQNFAGLWELM